MFRVVRIGMLDADTMACTALLHPLDLHSDLESKPKQGVIYSGKVGSYSHSNLSVRNEKPAQIVRLMVEGDMKGLSVPMLKDILLAAYRCGALGL